MKKLLLIDGSNVMFRAYYATAYSGNLMQNSKGEYTNAIFGLANMFNAIIKEDFTHVLVAFDKGKETFRHKEYEAYKAKRTKMPEEFVSQLPYVSEIVDKLGFFQYEEEALEADDIIGSMVEKFYDDFDEIEIISNDKDLFQLLNKKVTIRQSKRGVQPERSYTVSDLYDDYQLAPYQIPDLKGLMGDSSDNIPGVPGVGEKTALKLLHDYGSIEEILKNLNELKGKLKERISEHAQQALFCKKLATIIKNDPLEQITLDKVAYEGVKTEALIEFYQRMDFHSLIKKLDTPTESKDERFKIIKDESSIKNTLTKDGVLLLESYGDNYHKANHLGFVYLNDLGACFIPYKDAIASESFKEYLKSDLKKDTFDLKRLYVSLRHAGLTIKNVSFDLLLAAYVLNPLNTKEDFKVVVSNFDYQDVPYYDEVYGKGAKSAIPNEEIYIQYALKKALAIMTLKPALHDLIVQQNQEELLYEVELPLSYTLGDMEYEGIDVDQAALKQLDEYLNEELEELTKAIYQEAGESFNIGSPKQLGVILFEKLGLPSYKKSKTGYSTNVDVLNKLKNRHPIIEKIMLYRTLSKLQSTYVKGLSDAIFDDGKIHTIYKQAFTQTGRLSSIEPNLQNIPIRTERGREIRKVFIPSKNDTLLASDYSQIELRVLAHMALEENLIKAFKEDQDIHTITAKEIFEKETITSSERRIAKAVNFGIIYGQSAWGLSDELDISRDEAERFIDRYYTRFSGIAGFMDTVIDQAKKEGYVKTILNRRRYIPEMDSKIYAQRELGKRTAMNAPIQGSAADIIKIAMIKIDQAMKEKRLKSKLILQIHDELVFNVKDEELDTMKKLVKDTMEDAIRLKVPLKVNLELGANLDDAK
ncbi:MAG: DNA polymerase I [Candidatus Izemoplasmataceae bacterium]